MRRYGIVLFLFVATAALGIGLPELQAQGPFSAQIRRALDAWGLTTPGVFSGSLDITSTAADALDVAGGIQAGSGNVALVDATGQITSLDTEYLVDLSAEDLTTLNASALASGTVPTARLGSGTASSSTFLRGDNSWQTVSTFDPDGAVTINDTGADVDFRVESDDDANMIFVDGGNDRVGIGTNAPLHTLTVAGHGGYTTQATLGIDRSPGGGAYSTTGATGMLSIGSHTGSSNNNHTNASIRFVNNATDKWALGMTGQAGAPTSEFSLQNMVLDSVPFWIDGNSHVTFNDPGIDADFRVEGDTNAYALFVEGQTDRVGIGTPPVSQLHIRTVTEVTPVTIQRDSGTAGHGVGINFLMGDSASASAAQQYGNIYAWIGTNTNGAEDGNFTMNLMNDGSMSEIFRIFGDSGGMGWGSTDDPGADSIHIAGTLSKASGTFKIDHPLKPETHHLVHSFVESSDTLLVYRGVAEIVDGWTSVNLDDYLGLTAGTFDALVRDTQVWVSNDTGWESVRGRVEDGVLLLESRDPTATGVLVNFLIAGERQDDHIKETSWTDEGGNPILEPEK